MLHVSSPDPTTPSASRYPALASSAAGLAAELGCTLTFASWLLQRGFADATALDRFLEPRLAYLTPPDGMVDLDVASERIVRAIRARQRICVFGDYDCDGITATAVMTEVIRALGGTAEPRLASRFDGGYGVSPAAVQRILQTQCELLITCDCGSSDHAQLRQLRAAGVDVVVIDHHLVPDEPLPALAFLNPHRPECRFPYKGLASCGLALFVGASLRKALQVKLDLRQWLDLVAIGTIADVAPLDGDNRTLVRVGLERLREARRPGIRALFELGKIDTSFGLTARDVAFRIAPRLNAPGRLGAADAALELLLAGTAEQANALGAELEQLSLKRRGVQDTIVAEATAQIEEQGFAARAAIVVGREGWNHGIVGIVAGRLADKYRVPVIVVGFAGARGVGSVRGPAGSRLFDALAACEQHLTRFGGHQAAAGLEVALAAFDDLRQAFERACASQAQPEPATELRVEQPPLEAVMERLAVVASDDPTQLLRDLFRLEPCGVGNPSPTLLFDVDVLEARSVKGGHLKLELELAHGRRVSGFGVELGDWAGKLSGRVRLVGSLRPDTWRGGDAVEISVSEIL